MSEQRPCCAAAAARLAKKLTLRSGVQVGIWNLDSILREVAELNLADTEAIKKELLKRLKIHNYVARDAEDDYIEALVKEYGQLGKSK